MIRLFVYPPGDRSMMSFPLKEVKSTDVQAVTVVDEDGVERSFYGMPYSISIWPSNQPDLFGEK